MIDYANGYLIAVVCFLAGVFLLENAAAYLNLRSLSPAVPEEFAGWLDEDKYRKSQAYTKDKTKVGIAAGAVNLTALLAFILLGGFPWVDRFLQQLDLPWLAHGILYVAVLGLAYDLLNLPFELYGTFCLEERYGFNRTTRATFAADRLKGYMLMLVLGVPVLAGILLFFRTYPDWGWVGAWGFLVLVSLILQYVAPTWIMPLFNRFTPLQDGELKRKILDYAKRVDFDLADVQVMDGSKRSTKSNAFFTGFGKKKRIALFDTLIEKHEPDELVTVLAHEVGHYKLGHILKNTVLSAVKTGIMFYLLSLFLTFEPFFTAFGFDGGSVYAGLVLFGLFFLPVSVVLSLLFNSFSRRFEHHADRFASRTTGMPDRLAAALKRLARDNLSNLTPHPLYVVLEYSHPPVLERIRNLSAGNGA
jgi:STE24 endopeptidase